jgi:hypothetical protein
MYIYICIPLCLPWPTAPRATGPSCAKSPPGRGGSAAERRRKRLGGGGGANGSGSGSAAPPPVVAVGPTVRPAAPPPFHCWYYCSCRWGRWRRIPPPPPRRAACLWSWGWGLGRAARCRRRGGDGRKRRPTRRGGARGLRNWRGGSSRRRVPVVCVFSFVLGVVSVCVDGRALDDQWPHKITPTHDAQVVLSSST